jgi:hypothetical protein
MGEAMENEMYQELYAIRSLLQSMDLRSELVAIRQELQKNSAQLASIARSMGGTTENVEEVKEKQKGMFGFLK